MTDGSEPGARIHTEDRGVEIVSYFQVDNPLANVGGRKARVWTGIDLA